MTLTYRILDAVADRLDRDVTELRPLAETIDPESLDRLFDPQQNGTDTPRAAVRFRYHGFQVIASSNGDIDILEEGDRPNANGHLADTQSRSTDGQE